MGSFFSGGTKTATTTNTSTPWAEQTPYLKEIMGQAQNLYKNNTPTYYPGNTVAGFSPDQEQAFTRASQRSLNGNANMNAASQFNKDVLAGNYSGDPYQSQVFDNMKSQIMPAVNSQFTNAGRYGSGAHADQMTRALTESFAPYATQMHQQGLDRMGQAASMAPTFAQNDYTDIAAQADVGQQRQALAQQEIQDAQNRYNYAQDTPYNKLGQYLQFVGGNYGGVQTSQQPYQTASPFSQIAGAGLGLLGLLG